MKRTLQIITVLLGIMTVTGQAVQMPHEPLQQAMRDNITKQYSGFVLRPTPSIASQAIEWESDAGTTKRSDKSLFKAAGYSLLLPGLGQYYNGHKTKAKLFFGAEAITWAAFIAFRTYGGWKKDDYIRFGNVNAGAQLDGKDDDFLTLLEHYDNLDQYNNLGRLLEPGAPYLDNTSENYWRWQSRTDRATYTLLRRESRNAYKRGDWMIVLAVLNRVVSAIDAIRDARRAGNKTDESYPEFGGVRYKLELSPLSSYSQVRVTIYPGF